MANEDVIMEFIQNRISQHYCDDCLANILDIQPRQQVNQICNRLFKSNNIVRTKDFCAFCSKKKLVNKIG